MSFVFVLIVVVSQQNNVDMHVYTYKNNNSCLDAGRRVQNKLKSKYTKYTKIVTACRKSKVR